MSRSVFFWLGNVFENVAEGLLCRKKTDARMTNWTKINCNRIRRGR